jgi:hypothetical protein
MAALLAVRLCRLHSWDALWFLCHAVLLAARRIPKR